MLRMEFFAQYFASHVASSDQPLKVLDVGSFDVNGTYRDFFSSPQFSYTGLDMAPGPNVDIVPVIPYQWKELATDGFDIVISGQVLEHAEFFWITVGEMVRVTSPGGLIAIIVPNGFPEHRYPVDCYRFFTDGVVALARYYCLEILHAHTNLGPVGDPRWISSTQADCMLVARKPYAGAAQLVDLSTYTCLPADHSSLKFPL